MLVYVNRLRVVFSAFVSSQLDGVFLKWNRHSRDTQIASLQIK